MLLDLHYPSNKSSKANLVLDAFAQAYDSRAKHIRRVDDDAIQVFWGLANGNAKAIKECQQRRIPYIFTDMPYWHRWTKHNIDWSLEHAHWRIVPNDIHVTWSEQFSYDRLSSIGVELQNWKGVGDKILIAPSSSTLTQHLTGISDKQWADQVAKQCSKLYPDKLIQIRYKPRAQGTSGPDVEQVSVVEDIKNCFATVTLASLVGVEAVMNGVHNIVTHRGTNPADPVSSELNNDLVNVDRHDWANTLAHYQYSLHEIANNKIGHIIKKCCTDI